MGLGSDPTFDAHDPVPEGIVDRIVFAIFAIIGSVMGSAAASASAVLQSYRNQAFHAERTAPLSPAEAAVAVVKGWAEEPAAADEAAYSGLDRDRFDLLVKMSGNPPGPMDLLDQWRRGLVSDFTFEHGLRTGFLNNEWIGFFKNLRHVPLSPIQYLQGAVEGHIGLEEAKAKADGLGVNGADAQLIYDTLGNPPGIQEMLTLWNRGDVTEGQVDQAIRESHYKNKYLDAIKARRRYYPPPRTITTLVAHGAFTNEQALHYFQAAGLTPELAQAYLDSALHSRTASHKELSTATIRKLYTDRMMSRDEATGYLQRVGYSVEDAAITLDLADVEARNKVRQQVADKVRTNFIGRRINRESAIEDLAQVGVDTAHATELLDLWTIEQTTPSKTLTVQQLNQAVKKLDMPKETFIDRVIGLGYAADDAEILYELDVPPTPNPGG